MADSKNITVKQFRDFAEKVDERLDDLELNRAKGQEFTLSSNGWTEGSGDENFPYQYNLTVDGLTSVSRADAVLDAASVGIATVAGLCPVTETAENSVIFKSYEKPTSALSGVLYIKKSAAMSAE